jgi:hypothetical protein
MKGKLGTLLLKLQTIEYRISVYDDLIAYLGREGLEIPTPADPGVVPEEHIHRVLDELVSYRDELKQYLSDAEDVEIEHGLKDPGGFGPSHRAGR